MSWDVLEQLKNQLSGAQTEEAAPSASAGNKLEIYSYVTKDTVSFIAYLNSYSDSFSSNWSEEKVYGRMDPIPTFQNTQRKISVSFLVKGLSEAAAMAEVNAFFKMLYPGYETTGADNALTLNQAPLVRVKFGNIISKGGTAGPGTSANGLLGYISGLSYTPRIEQMFGISNGVVYPKYVDLSFDLTVLHEGHHFFDVRGFPHGGGSLPAPPPPVATTTADPLSVVDESPTGLDGRQPGDIAKGSWE